MHPEPSALRPYFLLTTTFVILGSAAGFAVWHLAAARSAAQLPAVSQGPDSGGARVRPVDFLESTTPKDRERLTTLVEVLTAEPAAAGRAADEAELLAFGAAAVPPLLTRLHRWATGPRGPVGERAAVPFLAIDRLLQRLRERLTPASPGEPFGNSWNAAASDARVAAWFAWWDASALARSD